MMIHTRIIRFCKIVAIYNIHTYIHTYAIRKMGLFDNKLYNFIMLLFVSGIIVKIMNFFDIEYVFYISYLLWFMAIGIFVIVLPRGQSSVI
jgi:hypothetical protein